MAILTDSSLIRKELKGNSANSYGAVLDIKTGVLTAL
jgi:hypothetical protein